MAQRIQTPISGVTTTSTYEDGETYSLVNLRPKNGALLPVPPRKIVQELSQKYDIIFVHQNNDYQNWIGVINDGGNSSVYWDVRNGQPGCIADLKDTINNVQQIGNTLSLITDDNIYYLFYQNGSYVYLGEIPQVPVIGLKTSNEMSYINLYFSDEYGSNTVNPDNFIDATKGLVNKAMDGLVNGWTDKDGVYHNGSGLQFFDACFIRYAFRLYDGSLTKHSPPILIMPTKHIVGREERLHSESVKIITYSFGSTLRDGSNVGVYGYKIYMDYDFSGFDNWKDIIQSIDIFVSAPLGISNIENIRDDMPTSDNSGYLQYNLIKGLSVDTINGIKNASAFYFMKSIPLGEVKVSAEFPSTDSSISKMENLIYQEVMADDNFSNHKYGASCSYVYNSRLHLANVKTSFFKGFNPDYFLWHNISGLILGDYNGYTYYSNAPGGLYTDLLIEVEINTGASIDRVYESLRNPMSSGSRKMFMSGFISYPDPRAKRLTIYRSSGSSWYKVFSQPLERHDTLNLAYFLNDGLSPIVENSSPTAAILPNDTSKVTSLTEPNKIKVSELSNPLSFPNKNTYQVGSGIILALATNAMNVSDRNYGQHPLYILTTQGIWTLNVGEGEVVYSTQSAPTYTEAPTTGVVGETPSGVVFTTQRGLLIINGQSVSLISPQIEQPPKLLNIEMTSHCDGVVFSPETNKFSELLRSVSGLIYNPYENELIINTNNTKLNYIYNFDSQQFYQSTEKIDYVVGNIYPQLFAVDGTTIKDYGSIETPLTHVSFITRPLKFGMTDIKKFERMILRGLLYNVSKPSDDKFSLFMVHNSMDGVNFKALTGRSIREGNIKDLDSGLMSRSKFSYWLYILSGVLSEESEIYYLDAEFDKEYNNSKMR